MTTQSIVIALVLLVAVTVAVPPAWHQLTLDYTFEQYALDFRKSYSPEEFAVRKARFAQTLASIVDFNKLPRTYKKGVNHLTDRSTAEILAMNGRLPDNQVVQPAPSAVFTATGAELPESFDYNNLTLTNGVRVLTAVKDQGHCGSCWAHAATESIESYYAKATGQLLVLSQQQVTSCTNNSQHCGGTGGCFGATAQIGWEYAQSAGGLTQEWMYGYTSYFGDSGVCELNVNRSIFVNVNGYTQVESNNAAATMEALVSQGPLAISVDASEWHTYESGIYDGCDYSKNISIDHAVQLVGYGFDETLNTHYWLVRNSWSAKFGEKGYIRLKRELNETSDCGWNVNWIGMGGGCPNGPNVTYTCGQCGILYDVAYPLVSNPNQSAQSSDSSKAWIAGAVVGGVAGAAIVGAIIFKVFFSSPSGSYGESTDLLDKPNVPLRAV